jgi:hypothetical protein
MDIKAKTHSRDLPPGISGINTLQSIRLQPTHSRDFGGKISGMKILRAQKFASG